MAKGENWGSRQTGEACLLRRAVAARVSAQAGEVRMMRVKISILSLPGLIIVATAALAIAGTGADANRLPSSVVIRRKPAAIWPWLHQSDEIKRRRSAKAPRNLCPAASGVGNQDRNHNARMEIVSTV